MASARNDNENNFIIPNLVKTILTSINFDSLSRKIKNPCLVIKKFISKGVCNMKHTKNILKSLLITVMALSLLAVSCKKDEGGSKPTDPTPITISEKEILDNLKGFKEVTVVTDAKVDFSAVTIGSGGTVDLTVTKNLADLTLTTFKSDMKSALERGTQSIASVTVTVADTSDSQNPKPEADSRNPVVFELTITAKSGYVLDAGIKGYQQADKTVKLTLKFTPSGSEQWK